MVEEHVMHFFLGIWLFHLVNYFLLSGSLLLKGEENGKSPVIKQVSWFQVVMHIVCIFISILVVNHVLLM